MPFVKYPTAVKLIYVTRLLAGDSLESINRTTGVSPREDTLAIWIKLFLATRSVLSDPQFHEPRGRPRILSPELRNFLLETVDEDPTLYLKEIAARLSAARGIEVSIPTLYLEIRDRLGLTLKVALTVDPAQDEMERARYLYNIRNIPVECFICYGTSGFFGLKRPVFPVQRLAAVLTHSNHSNACLGC